MPPTPAGQLAVPNLHRAARIEDALHQLVERRLRRTGWQANIIAYAGYGAPGWARVLCRVLLGRPDTRQRGRLEKVRGWRSFTTLPAKHVKVTIEAGGVTHEAHADRSGFVDTIVEGDFTPGWSSVRLSVADAEPAEALVRILDPEVRFGIISDIDDTVMVTALPRPLLAAWNTFVLDEHARAAVPGMAVLYERLATAHPGAPVFYLSTGAWNVAPTLTRFLSRHLYPAGPLLLTDWGPTADRWFRSGREHKRATLARLAREFPEVRWLLIGDDGQHDQEIYREFAAAHPDNVAGVAIRRLSPTQSVLAGSLPAPAGQSSSGPVGQKWLSAPDGAGLWKLLRDAGLV
ncbi:App1 family protein [Micromonospora purpureochromogenes]|uniref:Phosphatidate phosphatase APP1 n=1 Tax=Micromonospora purpureochromogenes TaxID=47872 RepID=A0ABX2RQ58_9ACTN|nr:phosphatase domain-containing protein [Micromonospora purpureochromogenes]NYF58210.1 phosphatidate phosphatase APP1 [Micromonospora purpureochromogenes]